MAEVRLGGIRIGFDYSFVVNFPAGFIEPAQGVRMSFRRHLEDPAPVPLVVTRDGDSFIFALDETVTANMLPGTYIGEAVVTEAGEDDKPLTSNRYIADCDHSPSEL